MTDPAENPPYRVQPDEKGFKVVDVKETVIIACSTSPNAEQYAALLNEAYRRGYKAGFREGKTAR